MGRLWASSFTLFRRWDENKRKFRVESCQVATTTSTTGKKKEKRKEPGDAAAGFYCSSRVSIVPSVLTFPSPPLQHQRRACVRSFLSLKKPSLYRHLYARFAAFRVQLTFLPPPFYFFYFSRSNAFHEFGYSRLLTPRCLSCRKAAELMVYDTPQGWGMI